MTSTPKGTWRLVGFITLCVLTVVGWAPLLGVLLSSLFSNYFGCTLNEAGAQPCVVGGVDYGEALSVMFVAGWFMLVTWPFMLLTAVAWLALCVAFIVRRVRRTRTPA